MSKKVEDKDRVVSMNVSVHPSIKEAMQRLAKADDRTVSKYVSKILTDYIREVE